MKDRVFYPIFVVPLLPPVWWYTYSIGFCEAYIHRLVRYNLTGR